MRYTELEGHIEDVESGKCGFSPMYALVGDDGYLKSQALKAFKSVLDSSYLDFNLSVVSSDNDFVDVISALSTYPVFDSVKIVVVPDASRKMTDAENRALSGYLKEPMPTSVFIAVCEGDAAKDFVKYENAVSVSCARLNDTELFSEIAKLMALPPFRRINNDASTELVRRTLGDMSRIAGETAKLKAYCDETVTAADVRELVAPDADFQMYEISEAVSKKDGNKALRLIDAFAKDGVRPMTVLSMLYNHYRKMLHAELLKDKSDAEVAALLGAKPAAIYHLRKVSSGYSQIRLKKCVDYLHNLQFGVLSGKRSESSAMNEAVLELLNI